MRLAIVLSIACATLQTQARAEDNFYGKTEQSGAALVGILYDLKQNQVHAATTVDNQRYWLVIDDFLASGWNEDILNKYFRASRPLYTTQIYIPRINAAEGPKAFGVETLVKPDRYVIHYKGQVSPPEDGTYRFVGFGDNILAVSLNHETVLFDNWCASPMPKLTWKAPDPPQAEPTYENRGVLANGRWFTLKAGEVADLDILIGESDGGASAFFLMIEKQGEAYPKTAKGSPILPIFQVAPFPTRHIGGPKVVNTDGPDFSDGKPWISVQ